jgi:hypothetical protein
MGRGQKASWSGLKAGIDIQVSAEELKAKPAPVIPMLSL